LAELTTLSSVSANSSLLHTPMAGTVTGGSSGRGAISDSGGRIAR
jgi:hypothetical protein